MKRLRDLFDIEYGNKLDFNKMTEDPAGISFVGRSGEKNGVVGKVQKIPNVDPYPAGLITVSLGGSRLLSAFLQQTQFYTAQNVAVLRSIAPMSEREKLFWTLCIRSNRYRYSAFGREANRTLRDLLVPDEVPSWVSEVADPDLSNWPAQSRRVRISLGDVERWERFPWAQLFEIGRGRYVPAFSKHPGETPSVSSTVQMNGVSDHIDIPPEWPGGTITVARNGSVGQAFYQPEPFFATDDVHVLKPIGWECTPARGLFLCTLIMREKYRYSYGRKWSLSKMRESTLPLPTTAEGTIDWLFIDEFMASRPWSAEVLRV